MRPRNLGMTAIGVATLVVAAMVMSAPGPPERVSNDELANGSRVALPGLALQSGDDPPVGTVVAWLKSFPGTPSLPVDWVECSGQVLSDPDSPFDGETIPDLNGATGVPRFLRGAAASGGAGGNDFHQHSGTAQPTNQTAPHDEPGGSQYPRADHVHQFSTSAELSLPSYYEVVWIMKIKGTSASTCFGDLTDDGSVGVNDFLALLGAWGPCP